MAKAACSRLGGTFHELFSAKEIAERVSVLGREITRDYQSRSGDLALVGVLKGSFLFLADLCRAIDLPVSIDFIGIASYGDQTLSSGVVQITSDLSKPIAGKHVLIVEDIIDTGLTAEYLLENFRTRHPESVGLCALLHKPQRTTQDVKIDYLGFQVPDKFVVGYGLDAAQRYRNLDFIGYIEP